jgi:hypothetical protein
MCEMKELWTEKSFAKDARYVIKELRPREHPNKNSKKKHFVGL